MFPSFFLVKTVLRKERHERSILGLDVTLYVCYLSDPQNCFVFTINKKHFEGRNLFPGVSVYGILYAHLLLDPGSTTTLRQPVLPHPFHLPLPFPRPPCASLPRPTLPCLGHSAGRVREWYICHTPRDLCWPTGQFGLRPK